MMKRIKLTGITAALLLLLVVAGCAEPGVSHHDSLMDFGSVQTVAILPLANLTRDEAAGERVRDTLATMLLATDALYVLPSGEVARGIARTGMADITRPSVEEVKKFCGITKADAVITGVVREYGEVRSGQTAANAIALSLQMLDSQTGSVVWSADTARGGITMTDRLFGGGGKPMDAVTRDAVNDLLDKLFE
jgi:hypothetical protein